MLSKKLLFDSLLLSCSLTGYVLQLEKQHGK